MDTPSEDESQSMQDCEPSSDLSIRPQLATTYLGKRPKPTATTPEAPPEKRIKMLNYNTYHQPFHAVWDPIMQRYNSVRNKSFIPKYIADLIPIPEYILANIYHTHLTGTERSILQGEYLYATHTAQIMNFQLGRKGDCVTVEKTSKYDFRFIMWNIEDTDPNSPEA